MASENRIEQVAFSLLSAGIFRGFCSLGEVLGLGVETIVSWGKSKPEDCSVSEIYLVAFSPRECITLKKICDKAFGVKTDDDEEQESDGDEMKIDTPNSGTVPDAADISKDENEMEPEDAMMKVDAPKDESAPNTTDMTEDENEKEPEDEIMKVDAPKAETAPDTTDMTEYENDKETGGRCKEETSPVNVAEKGKSDDKKILTEPPEENEKTGSAGKELPLVANTADMEKSENEVLEKPSGEKDVTEKSVTVTSGLDISASEVSGKPEDKSVETTTSETAPTSGSDTAGKIEDITDSKPEDTPGEGEKIDVESEKSVGDCALDKNQ